MIDDIEILDLILGDQAGQPSVYQPGRYWMGYASRVAKAIRSEGEPVRVDTLLNASLVGEARQEGPYIRGFQWLALEGAEQRYVSVEPEGVSLASL